MKSLTLSAILLATSVAAAQNAPTTIYIHGNILTGAHLRADDTSDTPAKVTAIAIANGKILAVGDDATIQALKSPNTKVIDLNGAFTMPGFNDAHTHIASAGQQKLTVDLDGTQSLKEMQDRIRAYAAKSAPGIWIQGGGWDHTKWPTKQLPTRADIDSVTAGHPAVFERTDGHIVVANSAALAAATEISAFSGPSVPFRSVSSCSSPSTMGRTTCFLKVQSSSRTGSTFRHPVENRTTKVQAKTTKCFIIYASLLDSNSSRNSL